jgi:hypothetical protein
MKKVYLLLPLLFFGIYGSTQNVGIGTNSPNANAILDISSNNKGVLIPRMDSVQRQHIANVMGLMVYDTTTKSFWYNNGTAWINISPKANLSPGTIQYWDGSNWIAVPPGQPGQFLQYSATGIPQWGGAVFATITTLPIDSITQSTAKTGVNVVSFGGSDRYNWGLCWDSFPNPTIALNTKTEGWTILPAKVSDLIGNTTYYLRAYVSTYGPGVVYGNERSFTTLPKTVPNMATNSITNMQTIPDTITGTYVKLTSGGNVLNSGGMPVTARGVCWSTSPGPTIALSTKTSDGTGTGSFSSLISNLPCFTRYYLRSYATNALGTGYGNEISFTTTYLGQIYYGWSVFDIDATGLHGLMAEQFNLNLGGSVVWGCSGTAIPGAQGTAIGSGLSNTAAILTACPTPGIAARLCNDVDNGIAYLPSRDELSLMLQRSQYINNLTQSFYWSSSEASSTNAWSISSTNPTTFVSSSKNSGSRVRAIKSF